MVRSRIILGCVSIALLACSGVLIACGRSSSEVTPTGKPLSLYDGTNWVDGEAARFKVTRVGKFADDLAYGDQRGIYVLVDTKTGQEYVGISGIGISELGSHRSGKTTKTDDR
jgi:hypothetical protein